MAAMLHLLRIWRGWWNGRRRFKRDELLPEEISRLLGAMPTSVHVKGRQLPSSPSGRIGTKKSVMWHLRAKETEPEGLDGQVSELLGQVTSLFGVTS